MYSGDISQIFITIIIAAVIGVVAGAIVGGGGKGILGNAFFGILGGLFANWLFPMIGISIGGQYSTYIEAVIGTCVVIIVFNAVTQLLFRKR